jgi:hypothetical protein
MWKALGSNMGRITDCPLQEISEVVADYLRESHFKFIKASTSNMQK